MSSLKAMPVSVSLPHALDGVQQSPNPGFRLQFMQSQGGRP